MNGVSTRVLVTDPAGETRGFDSLSLASKATGFGFSMLAYWMNRGGLFRGGWRIVRDPVQFEYRWGRAPEEWRSRLRGKRERAVC